MRALRTPEDIEAVAEVETFVAKAALDPSDPMKTAREIVVAHFTRNRDRVLYRHRGAFWQFQSGCYLAADDAAIRTAIWTFLEKAERLDQKGNAIPFKPNRARVSDALDALGAVCELAAHLEPPIWLANSSNLPPPGEFLPVANGLLHLPSGELYPPTPQYFGLSASGIAFNPDAPQPRHWLAFLTDLFGTDKQAIEALQDWFGYVLAPDTSQQKILLVVGPKRSGKGTIARVLREVVGRESVVGPTLASLSRQFGLEPLIGKPLAIISDARLGGRSDQAAIAEHLLSISGEDALTIDRKFRQAWTGYLSTRFMMLTNELPRLSDSSGALANRFIVLALENSFYGREDPALTGRLVGESPGILNWSLVGYRRLRARGHFLQPDSALDAIAELESLASPISAFIREKCTIAPGSETEASVLYAAWREWCLANGRREPGNVQTFGRDLRAAAPAIKLVQRRVGGDRGRFYQGIAIG